MALFKSENPVLSDRVFRQNAQTYDGQAMTIGGTMAKFGTMLLLLISTAVYSWTRYAAYQYETLQTLLWVGLIGGLVAGLIITFNPKSARYLAPVYSLAEGLFLGGISVLISKGLEAKNPALGGIAFQAIGLTLAVSVVMFALYYTGILKATQKFKSVVIAATLAVGLFYLVTMVLNMFHVNVSFMWNSSALGIGISLIVVVIAALNLIMDFDMIENGAKYGAPAYMEWYCAYGLLVTIVWLYIEILKLLSRLNSRK